MRNTSRRGLGARRIRALVGGWTARDGGVGALPHDDGFGLRFDQQF